MMKFPDLDFDCLESVLEYLGLIDLLNVADSTKRLRKAAELVFSCRFGKKTVSFGAMKMTPDESFTVTEEGIKIECLKTGLQLLRCVGCAVSKIEIHYITIMEKDFENQSQVDRKLFTYINNYCAEYLKEISITNIAVPNQTEYFQRGSLDYFDKPFKKLVYLSACDYNFTEQSCLEKIFPNLQEIYLCCPKNTSFHKNHFPYLQKLTIMERDGQPLKNEMVSAFLQLNPQLKELKLRSENLNINLIRSAVDSLQNIETLILEIDPTTTIQDSENCIHMKSVKKFDIEFYNLDEMHLYLLPFSFEQLDKFSIYFPKSEFHSAFIQQFYNFIDKHSTITYLEVTNIGSSGAVNWLRLAKMLPSLVAIKLKGCRFSTDEAIDIMAKFQMIKRFELQLSGEFDNFRERLDKKWKATHQSIYNYNWVKLKRII